MLKAVNATQKQIDLVKLHEQAKRNLEEEIQNYREEAQKQRKIIFQLEKERDRYINEASDLTQKVSHSSMVWVEHQHLFFWLLHFWSLHIVAKMSYSNFSLWFTCRFTIVGNKLCPEISFFPFRVNKCWASICRIWIWRSKNAYAQSSPGLTCLPCKRPPMILIPRIGSHCNTAYFSSDLVI